MLRTPRRAPRANAIGERLLGSVRRECLDHILILGEGHLQGVLKAYIRYFNHARPHQGVKQQDPEPGDTGAGSVNAGAPIVAFPVLGGLHHDYRKAA